MNHAVNRGRSRLPEILICVMMAIGLIGAAVAAHHPVRGWALLSMFICGGAVGLAIGMMLMVSALDMFRARLRELHAEVLGLRSVVERACERTDQLEALAASLRRDGDR